MTNKPSGEQPKLFLEEVTPTFRIIHTEACLTSNAGCQISRNERPEDDDWSPLAMEVLEIPGVETVVVRPYGLGIHRALAFEWDPILCEAERILYWVGHAFNPDAPDLLRGKSDHKTTLTKLASEGGGE